MGKIISGRSDRLFDERARRTLLFGNNAFVVLESEQLSLVQPLSTPEAFTSERRDSSSAPGNLRGVGESAAT
jgi:hypothetical protein